MENILDRKIPDLYKSVRNVVELWKYKKTLIAVNRNPAPIRIMEPNADKPAWNIVINNIAKPLPLKITFRDGEMWDCTVFPPTKTKTVR